jgi:hypothetical protein
MCEGVKVRMSKVGTKIERLLLVALFFGWGGSALAAHGPMTTSQRDAWVDRALGDLISGGLVAEPSKPLSGLTNLEVAQLTKEAGETLMAQAPSAMPDSTQTAAGKSLGSLVEEFKKELAVMDLQVRKLEDRLYTQEHLNEKFAAIQMEDLKRTGTNLSGGSRGWLNDYRGFGANAVYSPMDYNGIMTGDIVLKSVPVPFVLFNADLRMVRTIGLYYADPVTPQINLRWLSFTNANEICNLTAGDFFRHYTPLTLWNSENPVFTLTEPTSYYRVRKDFENLNLLDRGPDWHMRGFELASDQAMDKNPIISSFHAQVMAGELTSAGPFSFASEYAGSQASIRFLDDNVELKGVGLLLFNDPDTANVPYIPSIITTFAHTYQIGSLSAAATLPIDKDLDVKGNVEYAGSWYQDDSNNSQSVVQDWAMLVGGAFDVYGAHLTLKYLNNGPYFYSPGAQTNRFNPSGAGGTSLLDDGSNGFSSSYVFQGVGRPTFMPYDRMVENMLPYGDATPNRQGLILGFAGEFGKDGWLKPQGSYVLNIQEVQPDYVLTPLGNSFLPVDTNTPGTQVRKFGGFEGALTLDLAKALDNPLKTLLVSGDFKHETTDLGNGASPFQVDNLILALDAGPFPDVPLFEGLVLSGSFEQAKAQGNEYVTGGNPSTLADYATYFDTGMLGQFVSMPLNITRTSWAIGAQCPISRTIEVHADLFINQYTWSDFPSYDRRENIWRLTYVVSF